MKTVYIFLLKLIGKITVGALLLWLVTWMLWTDGECDRIWMCHFNHFMESNWYWVVGALIVAGFLEPEKK